MFVRSAPWTAIMIMASCMACKKLTNGQGLENLKTQSCHCASTCSQVDKWPGLSCESQLFLDAMLGRGSEGRVLNARILCRTVKPPTRRQSQAAEHGGNQLCTDGCCERLAVQASNGRTLLCI